MSFKELGLLPEIVQAIEEYGYETPTPIQAQAIPVIAEGRDLIGSAQTGTGKTAAFTLPMLSRLKAHKDGPPRALILEPTRELAGQVMENFEIYTKHLDLRATLLYGGVGYGKQLQEMNAGVDCVVATPGRLLDHISQKNLSLENIEVLVLDEVDRMLDMGFIEDVSRIVRYCRKDRQTLLFSATIPDAIKQLSGWALVDPVTIDTGGNRMPAETIDHAIYPVDGIQKYDLLLAMLRQMDYSSVLIFTRTKVEADRVTRWLIDHDLKVTTLHADRTQREREESLKGFKANTYQIMVATDIASRGLDISDITHVINFSVPQHPEDYVHRIGRTGRASRDGEALTIFATDEEGHLAAVERYIGRPIERRKVEGFRYRNEPAIPSEAQPVRRRRNRGFGGSSSFGKRRR